MPNKTRFPVLTLLARQRRELQLHERNLEESVRKRTAALRETVEALRQSKERYQRLLESITSYVYTVRIDQGEPGQTQHGPGCQAVTGYAPEAFQERPYLWIEMVHPEDRAAVQAQARAILTERRPQSFEHRIHHQDGTVRWVRNTLVPHLDAQGALASYDGVILDISEHKRAEAERSLLEAQLFQAQRLESLGNLAGGVAHDINNVLAAILGLASSNRERVPPGPLAQSLDTITSACMRGREVVKSLLYFARKDMAAAGPVDLNLLVRQIVHLLDATTLKRVRITTDLQEPLGLLEGEEAAISHALMNLCVNALDAMPGGGALVIRTRRLDAGGLEVRVRDTGEGMTAQVLAKAIDPFFTTKPMGKGTGLGLAMVYGTMKAHGGTLELHSEPGQGTEVVLAFPPPQDTRSVRADPAAPASPQRGAALRILLVDDDELIRLSIPSMLEALGHQVQTAESGQEALERLAAGLEADLVILDMRMPGMSGSEALPRLLALRPGLAVLLATGHADQEIQDLLADRRNVACIQKPFTMAEVRAKVLALTASGQDEKLKQTLFST
jgi:PAS domain S-box-containing protein